MATWVGQSPQHNDHVTMVPADSLLVCTEISGHSYNASYSMIALYSRDGEGVGVACDII